MCNYKVVSQAAKWKVDWRTAVGSWVGQSWWKRVMTWAILVTVEMGGMDGSEAYLGGGIDKP